MAEFLFGTMIFLLYIFLLAGLFFTARVLVKIPDEQFRKILHFILLGAYIPLCFAFETWWKASLLATLLGSAFMVLLAFLSDTTDKGHVIPGLSIAVMGVIANTAFWIKYIRLNRKEPNAILQVQSRLLARS